MQTYYVKVKSEANYIEVKAEKYEIYEGAITFYAADKVMVCMISIVNLGYIIDNQYVELPKDKTDKS